MAMHVLPALRVFLFASIILFSVVVLAVLFNFEALSSTVPHSVAFRLGIASAIATIAIIVATLIVDLVRKGRGFTSMTWFDLVRTFALWALWLATAVSITTGPTIESCEKPRTGHYKNGQYQPSNSDDSICLLFRISQVSAWIVTFLTFSWFLVLLITSNVAIARGYANVWTSPLRLHPIGIGRSSQAPPPSDAGLPPYDENDEKFVPSPYGLLVSSYAQRSSLMSKPENGGPGPGREGGAADEVGLASTSTFTVRTVHLDPPPPAVVAPTAPTAVDLEAQQPQPQPRRID